MISANKPKTKSRPGFLRDALLAFVITCILIFAVPGWSSFEILVIYTMLTVLFRIEARDDR